MAQIILRMDWVDRVDLSVVCRKCVINMRDAVYEADIGGFGDFGC
jgi:hypothetical protein